MAQLEDRMFRLTQQLAETEPEQAARLQQALQRARELLISRNMDEAIQILARTPSVLQTFLVDLPAGWTESGGDLEDWRPFDVVGHLIHGELTDWIPRARTILEQGEGQTFEPFDRVAQFERSAGKTLSELVDEFAVLRRENLEVLRNWQLGAQDLDRSGRHPELGRVTLQQLLATWVVHDLNHLAQICRSMAGLYVDEVGPWRQYLSILIPPS